MIIKQTKSIQIVEINLVILTNFDLDLINSEKYQTEENVTPRRNRIIVKNVDYKQNKD